MERRLVTSTGKIRDRYPESPVKPVRKIGNRKVQPQTPVVFKEVAGVQADSWARIDWIALGCGGELLEHPTSFGCDALTPVAAGTLR